MKKTIELKSRYGDTYLLNRIGEEDSHLFSIGDWEFYRFGEIEKGIKFIDTSGGPFLTEGTYVKEADAVIKSIDYIEGQGFTITFK